MQQEADPTSFLRSFLDIGVQLTQELDIGHVLMTIVERSMELTGARYGAALTLTTEGEIEDFLYRGMTPEQVQALPHVPRGEGLLGLVLSERATLSVADISKHSASVGFPYDHVAMQAFLGVPLMHRAELIGALYLTKPPGVPRFSRQDEEIVRAMAAMAAVGIEKARLFTAEHERAQRTALLRDISQTVRSSLDVDDVLSSTVETLGRAANVERCFIRMIAPETRELGPIEYEWDAEEIRPLKDNPGHHLVASLSSESGLTEWSDDLALDDRLQESSLRESADLLLKQGVRAALATPIEWGGHPIGVVIFHSTSPRPWSKSDVLLIEAAAREVAVAIHQARLYGQAVGTAHTLKQHDQTRSEFVSMMTHEVRSPMTVVAGIADILDKWGDELSSEKRANLIQTLGREARRLTKLVSEVLDVEGVQQGAVKLEVEDVDLVELAAESVADANQSERTDIVRAGDNAIVPADRDKIKQVFLNLVSNATKFSPDGSPITLTITPRDDDVSVAVADSGRGIADDDLGRLFQPFTRLEAKSGGPQGSGMGLYLCKTIVERHGGDISAANGPSGGCVFSFRLPRAPSFALKGGPPPKSR